MSPERWQEVDRLLQSVLQQPPDRRAAFLRQACGADAALEEEVRSLLAAQQEAGSFLENGAMDAAAHALASRQESDADQADAPRALPAWIGRYRILRLIGEGGMGVGYEAEQDVPDRIVALKLIKPGFDRREVLRGASTQESWALGRLHHPGIAQIYEAGVDESGREPAAIFRHGVHPRRSPLRDIRGKARPGCAARLRLMAGDLRSRAVTPTSAGSFIAI